MRTENEEGQGAASVAYARTKKRMLLLAAAALAAIVIGIGCGSVHVSLKDIWAMLLSRLPGQTLPDRIPASFQTMILDMRLPRVLLAFLTGAALAACGSVTQSVLQNPLASPFGIGISSGAGLGAALVIVLGLSGPKTGVAALPLVSLIFALGTVFLVMTISARLDKGMSNVTVILVGMVLSLFCNAIMNLLASASPRYAQQLQLWQLGSFSMKEWSAVAVLFPVAAAGLLLFLGYSREMDAMSFGEEQARAMGVDLIRTKRILLLAVSVLTGTAVAFVGIIGFVDLIAPHVARKWMGARQRPALLASAMFGGTFLVLCDLAARTLMPPREIPIGSITALIGAPFFFYVFFVNRKKSVG